MDVATCTITVPPNKSSVQAAEVRRRAHVLRSGKHVEHTEEPPKRRVLRERRYMIGETLGAHARFSAPLNPSGSGNGSS